MKKRLLCMGTALLLGMSVMTGCGKEEKSYEEAKKLKNAEDTVIVLCDSKASNDMDEFLSLFEYMESLMKMVVNGDENEDGVNDFEAISNNYKEECGSDFTWEYKIKKKTDITDEKKLEEYTENTAVFGNEEEVTKACDITAEIHLEGDKGEMDYTLEITAGQVDGKWQIVTFDDTLLK